MRSLRIQGLVGLAQHVRHELRAPLAAEHREHLRQLVAGALTQMQRILTQHAATIEHVSGPTRRAYQFLSDLKLDAVAAPSASVDQRERRAVTLVGLKSSWERMLDGLARAPQSATCEAWHETIVSTSDRIERDLRAHAIQEEQLSESSRTIRGWLLYFRSQDTFATYCAALAVARPIIEAAMEHQPRCRGPLLLHFRPTPSLYRLRTSTSGTRILLPTPMITFHPGDFRALAETIFARRSRQPVVEAVTRAAYQAIRRELDALCGLVERPTGLHHDLAAAFARVHGRYFDRGLTRPRLAWSRTYTGRKFGHYDPMRDTVMISCSLDQPDVHECVVDFVLYHELLHRELGIGWRGNRIAAHTPEFRKAERRFERYAEVQQALRRLTSGGRTAGQETNAVANER
jgi:hypothetical protein